MSIERDLMGRAGQQCNHLTRADVLGAGGSDSMIKWRLGTGRWIRRHAGVYCLAPAPTSWSDDLQAAVLAAGPVALISHLAALVVWDLDGVSSAPVELTVPYEHRPVPAGVRRHRTRRRLTGTTRNGIPVTTVERTLLDCASRLSPTVLEKALDSAVRRGLTTYALVAAELARSGGRGVKGTRKLRAILAAKDWTTAPGSPAETAFLRIVREEGLESPELQAPIGLPDGTVAVVDCLWRRQKKIVEVDGLDAHGSAAALESDLHRQNQLLAMGYELRRYSARTVRRNPRQVGANLRNFLAD